MMTLVRCSLAAILLAATGCATSFQGVSLAEGDSVYVVGSSAGFFSTERARIWRCPTKVKGECKNVEVQEK